jgi:AraC family mar-sox-rob regulon transcriptional activator
MSHSDSHRMDSHRMDLRRMDLRRMPLQAPEPNVIDDIPGHGAQRHLLARREPCPLVDVPPETEEPAYLPLSRTTDRVLRMLLEGDLSRTRAESVAETLGISCTTLRRRLRNDHTSYQFLLDRARQYRCEARLRERWLPGKCLADELGYLEINSFYRAFRRWTGLTYSEYKLRYH